MKNKQLENQLKTTMFLDLYTYDDYGRVVKDKFSLPVLSIYFASKDIESSFMHFSKRVECFADKENPTKVWNLEYLAEYVKSSFIKKAKDEEDIIKCYDILAKLLIELSNRIIPVAIAENSYFFFDYIGELDYELSQVWEYYVESNIKKAKNGLDLVELSTKEFDEWVRSVDIREYI